MDQLSADPKSSPANCQVEFRPSIQSFSNFKFIVFRTETSAVQAMSNGPQVVDQDWLGRGIDGDNYSIWKLLIELSAVQAITGARCEWRKVVEAAKLQSYRRIR